MLPTIALLLVLNFAVAHAGYSKRKDLGTHNWTGTIVPASGNKLEIKDKDVGVRLYTNADDFGPDAGLFHCLFPGDADYNSVQGGDPLSCVALHRSGTTCDDNVVYGFGLTEKKNKDLCCMSDAGLSCGLDAPSKKAEAAKALAEQLKDHNEEIAKCASKLILADTTTPSKSGEDDKDTDSSEV
ncbi:hypothetical protein OESDEN_25002 [Oesophagostomum dentatum]|uniref:Uncharacterized protein n=1 Tax=Oesophagostomum dentatum TaxID=61180 RepID=A0A0B1RW27_OESDE|nr:hypothetical protein OESDEN_25002 [Oesophagostomum dentatum]